MPGLCGGYPALKVQSEDSVSGLGPARARMNELERLPDAPTNPLTPPCVGV